MSTQNVLEKTTNIAPNLSQALQKLREEGEAWGPAVVVDQAMVDVFTALTGDHNAIHRASSSKPIVPGLLTLSLLPKLTSLTERTEIAGHTVLNIGVECDFFRPFPTGEAIRLRFRPDTPSACSAGIFVKVAFTIGLAPGMKAVARGSIKLLLQRPATFTGTL